ncbi:MAG: imidazole glycerol-phosphate synthase subunit HisF, partial [Petrotoga sp.]|nr:imidazole glycerol-phosphate synthase subunit HisF [Petrotoga sp.]
MLTKRIVAALDIKEGRVVKGVQFENIQDAGDPVQLAKKYEKDGVDEIVFLDITASKEKRNILKNLVE